MGIQGLLPLLKSIQKPTHLRNFAGQTLGVDAYGWLHRGTIACAIELAQQKPTRKHIDFALSRVRMLIHFGVKPYLVFDGAYLPSKEHTEKERAARREESKKLGLEALAMNRLGLAYSELQKAIDVTPLMARELIDQLKHMQVPYLVAPYEADSQLAYLEKQGLISGVLSEDSDLLVFGVKCLLTKLDQYGECVMVNRADFTACQDVSLVGWTDQEFRTMAMLSGCDYLPGIEGIGPKTAYRHVRKHKAIDRLVRALHFDGKKKIPPGYLEAFDRAEKTFLYQLVFCPKAQRVVHLNELPPQLQHGDMPFIGSAADPETASAVAAGDLDPNTKERLLVKSIPQYNSATRNNPLATPDETPSKSITQFFKPTTSFATPDEKPGKSIKEFFKSKRTPLAELDPNSFAQSPSQQALLQNQQGASWSASQVRPDRPSILNQNESVNGPSSAPQPHRRTVSDRPLDSRRTSPKRQRLCSDSTISAAMNGSSYESNTKSRFFSANNVEPSPSLRKPSAQRKRVEDFELWSDDPVAEAAAQILSEQETTHPQAAKTKKLKVYTDSQEDAETERPTAESQDSAITKSTQASSKAGEQTPLTSFETEPKETERSIFTSGIDADFASLKSKYSLNASTPVKQAKRTRSTPLHSRSPSAQAKQNHLLGRLAKQARNPPPFHLTNHDRQTQEDDAEEPCIAVPRSSPPQAPSDQHEAEQEAPILSDQEWFDLEQRDATSPSGCLLAQGSEDFLVPNSPESRDSEGETKVTPAFDLNRFAFVG